MQRATHNDKVTVNYTGSLAGGEVFESSADSGPLVFQIGDQSVLPAFERAVIGMAAGETKAITLAAEEAYGPRREELLIEVPRNTFGQREVSRGMVLGLTMDKDGEPHQMPATVVAVTTDTVTVDFNHPLAGQALTYHLTVQAVDESNRDCGCECTTQANGCSPSTCSGCSN